jgi:3-(3-hydroxy-phenyl)propionate hydroxylase
VQARYAIGCDGATSTVRNAVGVALQDLGFAQAWLVADVLVNEQGAAKLPQTSVQYCEPARPSTFLIGPKNHRRWEISINPGEDPQQVATPEGTWQLLTRWITPQDGRLWRQASYRFHALVADEWRKGRVFVAGDAAHQQPPFLGQGMCQGIRDAANLSWKLGAVLRGEASASLLDTYGHERKAHVTELTTRIKGIGQLVGERDLAKARARDAHLLAECGGVVKSVPRQNVQPALAAGLLSASAHAARGTLFPQPWVMHGGHARRLDEVVGTGWRVVLSPAAAGWPLALPGWMQRIAMGTEMPEQDGVAAHWWHQMGTQAAIVRPDHYVYGVASNAQALQLELDGLSATLKGCSA